MTYVCDVCGSTSKPSQPCKKITKFREVEQTVARPFSDGEGRSRMEYVKRTLLQIEKELKACPLCFEGHCKGIPLDHLAKMHRPKPPELKSFEELGRRTAERINEVALQTLTGDTPSPIETPAASQLLSELIAGLDSGGGKAPAKSKKQKANASRKDKPPKDKGKKVKPRRPLRDTMDKPHSSAS